MYAVASDLDISGIGKVAEAIPKEGWQKAIDTACDTFTDLISPITKTTAGLGGLIQAKFDAMIDVQKVFAADAVRRARLKVEHIDVARKAPPSARVLISAIEEASVESDENLRDIWANLIANEISVGSVHPEYPKMLSRLSAQDAAVLSKIAENSSNSEVRKYSRMLAASVSVLGISISAFVAEGSDAQHEHLERLALIAREDGRWILTHFGEAFVTAVTDPSLSMKQST